MWAKTVISKRLVYQLMAAWRTVLHYAPQLGENGGWLHCRIVDLEAQRRRFGYRRIHALLRQKEALVLKVADAPRDRF